MTFRCGFNANFMVGIYPCTLCTVCEAQKARRSGKGTLPGCLDDQVAAMRPRTYSLMVVLHLQDHNVGGMQAHLKVLPAK